MEIKIGNKEYIVEVAKTEDEHFSGLSNKKSLDDNKGMLFIYDEPEDVTYWMKDTTIPLDIIFIDDDNEVICIKKGIPNSTDYLDCEDVKYVLEVNTGSKVRKGQELKLPEELRVIDSSGSTQMVLKGGERIFSRRNTEVLMKKAKKAFKSDDDKDYISLGNKVFAYLEIQDNREPDFVKQKD